MTAEQQLERSVLEGKERDELSAIAQAMSLKTTSRTKKADIIDQILDATGVTSGGPESTNGDAGAVGANGAKPSRRTRSTSGTAEVGADTADAGAPERGHAPAADAGSEVTAAAPAEDTDSATTTVTEAGGAGHS